MLSVPRSNQNPEQFRSRVRASHLAKDLGMSGLKYSSCWVLRVRGDCIHMLHLCFQSCVPRSTLPADAGKDPAMVVRLHSLLVTFTVQQPLCRRHRRRVPEHAPPPLSVAAAAWSHRHSALTTASVRTAVAEDC